MGRDARPVDPVGAPWPAARWPEHFGLVAQDLVDRKAVRAGRHLQYPQSSVRAPADRDHVGQVDGGRPRPVGGAGREQQASEVSTSNPVARS